MLYTYIGPPNITYIDHSKVSVEGDNSSLTCIAVNDDDSDRSLRVQWYNSSGIRVLPDESRIFITHKNWRKTGKVRSVILFNPVNRTDRGVYTCKVFNHVESYAKENANLIVKCKLCMKIFMSI